MQVVFLPVLDSVDAAIGGAVGGGVGTYVGSELGGMSGAVIGGDLRRERRCSGSHRLTWRVDICRSSRSRGAEAQASSCARPTSYFCPPGQAKKRALLAIPNRAASSLRLVKPR